MNEASEKAVEIVNGEGCGPAVIVCEHAANHIPQALNRLGLDAAARISHAAWDPGAEPLARRLAYALDAPMVAGRLSRLVYDCNRPPDDPGAVPGRSETMTVPGNIRLSDTERAERTRAVYTPFTTALSGIIARRQALGTPFALVTIHSFNPTWFGTQRSVEIGLLHDTDTRLADAMLVEAQALPHRLILRNTPYGPEDGVMHTLRLHGLANGLPNIMIEVRNDLLDTDSGQDEIASELLRMLRPALSALMPQVSHHA